MYRAKRQTVLVVDTAKLLAQVGNRPVLSPLNTGATKPMPHPRGDDCFMPLHAYPFAEWSRRRRGREPAVELAVPGMVQNVERVVERALSVGGGRPAYEIWPVTGRPAEDW